MEYLQNVMGYFDQQQPLCAQHDKISKDLYQEFGVKAGLRDENGKGVLAGLTNISDIRAFEYVNGVKRPADGQLLYRGYDVKDLINGSRGSRLSAAVRRTAHPGKTAGVLRGAGGLPHHAHQLHPGRHHESAQPRHHERHGPQCADPGFL